MLLKDLKNTTISIPYWEYEEMIRKIDRLEVENQALKDQLECERSRNNWSYWYWLPKVTYLSNTNTQQCSTKQSPLRSWSQIASFLPTTSWKDS